MVIDEKLLEMLVCPLTHDKLRVEGDMLVNVKWGIKYPVRNGIAIMLLDEAQWPEGIGSLEEMKKNGFVKPTHIDYEKEAQILKKMYEKEKDPSRAHSG